MDRGFGKTAVAYEQVIQNFAAVTRPPGCVKSPLVAHFFGNRALFFGIAPVDEGHFRAVVAANWVALKPGC
ncbi:MAG: hypothetical protein RI963_3641, partial [Planctomycetota bacterium]